MKICYVIILLISAFPLLNTQSAQAEPIYKTTAFLSRGPIFINSNADFGTYASSGDGSEAHPYIITNFNITASTDTLITISNTDKHFKVTGNWLNNINYGLDGIYLIKAINGEIEYNNITNSRHGIYLDISNGISVHDNTISDTSESGIRVNNSDSNNISLNTISNTEYNGIWLNQSNHNLIASNTITEVKNTSAIWLKSNSNENVVIDNKISNTYHGILVSSSNNNTISNNFLNNNLYAIYASPKGYLWDPFIPSQYNNFTNNTLYNSNFYGLSFEEGVINSSVSYNMFLRNNLQGSSQIYDNGTNNTFIYNFYDEWTGPDDHSNINSLDPDSDTFVDDCYIIDGLTNNNDSFPLTNFVSDLNFDFLSRPRIYQPITEQTHQGYITISWTPVLNVLDPNGVSYRVYYSNNSGNTWINLVNNLNVYIYEWNTYSLPNGTEYLIKVEAYTMSLMTFDLLDDVITIENGDHTLFSPTITSPAINDIVSETIPITWSAAIDSWSEHTITYALSYSNNSGVKWYLIQDNIASTTYNWDTTTVPDGATYTLQVIAYCSGGLHSPFTLNGVFEIRNTPHTLTQVVLQTPNGGETISGFFTVTWSAVTDSWDHHVTYSLYYSNNSGSSWNAMVSNLDTTEYTWNTSSLLAGTQYLVKVVANCSDLFTEDSSNEIFTISQFKHALSQLTVISPNGSETVKGIITITWSEVTDNMNHEVTYSVFYSTNNGSKWILISANITATSLSWDTNNADNGPNNLIKVVASCSEGLTTEDVSDRIFTINNIDESSSGSASTGESSSSSNVLPDNAVIIIVIIVVTASAGSVAGLVAYRRFKSKK